MNPPLSSDAIRWHLNTLEDAGVVRVREFEPVDRLRDFPDQFFELTDNAREIFDQNGLFPEDAWQHKYQTVGKPSRIRDVETMPRPDV